MAPLPAFIPGIWRRITGATLSRGILREDLHIGLMVIHSEAGRRNAGGIVTICLIHRIRFPVAFLRQVFMLEMPAETGNPVCLMPREQRTQAVEAGWQQDRLAVDMRQHFVTIGLSSADTGMSLPLE
jgi:hypothetical protein